LQILAGLACLALVASVSGRPEQAKLAPLPPADLPKELVKATEEPVKPTGESVKPTEAVKVTEGAVKVAEEISKLPEKGDKQAEDAFLASLPQTLPGKDAVQVPVVIADLPEPEAVVVVPNGPRGRFLARMARAHLPAEARGAEGDG